MVQHLEVCPSFESLTFSLFPYIKPHDVERTGERWRVARTIARAKSMGDAAKINVPEPYREMILETWRTDVEELGNVESHGVELRIEAARKKWQQRDAHMARYLYGTSLSAEHMTEILYLCE